MRSKVMICLVLLSGLCFSQEIPPDLLKKMEEAGKNKEIVDSLRQSKMFTAKKGSLFLKNGNYTGFTGLQLYGDSVTFLDSAKVRCQYPVSEIYWLKVNRRQTGQGALIGLGAGLVTGVLAGTLAYPENNIIETIIDLLFTDETNLSKKAFPMIGWFTLGGTAIGTLAGLATVKEKYIIDNSIHVSIKPEIYQGYAGQQGIMIKGTIRF